MIDIRRLTASYGGKGGKSGNGGKGGNIVLALDRFTVEAGQHTLVLGPSGCGKTTLLNIVAGIMPAICGEVEVNGTRLDKLGASERDHFRGRHIGLVMQRLHLISALTVDANLQLAQRLAHGAVDDARISEILATLGIADKRHAYPRHLSQGEAQRVAIARAVVNRPVLILADEPTAALDDKNCAAAIQLLFDQADQHRATLLVATHDARIKSRFGQIRELAQ